MRRSPLADKVTCHLISGPRCFYSFVSVAQLVERRPEESSVTGSSPVGCTMQVTGKAPGRSPKPSRGGSIPSTCAGERFTLGNRLVGRTAAFEAVNAGSSPAFPSEYMVLVGRGFPQAGFEPATYTSLGRHPVVVRLHCRVLVHCRLV